MPGTFYLILKELIVIVPRHSIAILRFRLVQPVEQPAVLIFCLAETSKQVE
jgi:hypothetical protein